MKTLDVESSLSTDCRFNDSIGRTTGRAYTSSYLPLTVDPFHLPSTPTSAPTPIFRSVTFTCMFLHPSGPSRSIFRPFIPTSSKTTTLLAFTPVDSPTIHTSSLLSVSSTLSTSYHSDRTSYSKVTSTLTTVLNPTSF